MQPLKSYSQKQPDRHNKAFMILLLIRREETHLLTCDVLSDLSFI